MALIKAYQSRNLTKDITVQDGSSSTITLGDDDKLRIIIGVIGQTAKLTLVSGTASAAGSTITKNSPSSGVNRLNLKPEDLAFDPGTYTMLVDMFDNADSEWKTVDRQVFHLSET